MKNLPNISDTEWEIMRILWAETAPVTSNHIIEKLSGTVSWNHKTIRTLIGRLVKKRAIGFDSKGNSYFYYALVSDEECINAETQSFLKRISGQAFKVLFTNFIEEQSLTEKELEDLKNILDKKISKGDK